MKIVHVRTEYLQNPIGIDIVCPRIRWNVEDCVRQTAFEIDYSVNGKPGTSGKVESSSTYYDFPTPFTSRDHVSFHVTCWEGKTSSASDENCFEIGLLKKEDWKALWISGDYSPKKKKRYPVDCFRKEFSVENVSSARLYLSAMGIYEAHINGKRVGSFVLAPGSTDYRKRFQYQTYDVTSLLQEGTNELTIALADGWYRGSIGARGKTCVFGKTTAVLAQLEIRDEKGNLETLFTDGSFSWSNDGPIRFADLKDGESCDFSKAPSYSGKARAVKRSAVLTAGNNSFIEEHETFLPEKEEISGTGKHVYSFHQNLAGYPLLCLSGRKGDHVRIRMGELLDDNRDVSLANVQLPNGKRITPMQQVDLFLKDGENRYHPSFFIAGFRYLEVDCPENVRIISVRQTALYSTMEETSSFECSNELINRFYRNTLWSLKSNSADVPTDCPTRERMGWTGDSQVFFNSASYLLDYAAFSRKHVLDIYDRQDKNGRLPQIAPYNAEDWFMDVMNGSVGWADAGVLIPYRFYKKYGDVRILERYYDSMNRYAHFMIHRCGRSKGIYSLYSKPLHLSKENRKYGVNTGQSYGEWAEPNDVKPYTWLDFCQPHPEESMAYTSYILDLMCRIAALVHREQDIPLFRKYSDNVKKAYQELVSKPRFTLDTDRQCKMVRPLYMHLLTDEQTEFAKKRLIAALDHYRWRLGTGFLSTPFILDVLTEIGPEHAYKLLENEEMPGWLYMAKNDTGTIWEGWEGPNSQLGISSLNHYSKGAMVEWLFRGMCGIHVDGENRFLLSPVIGGKVTYAKAEYRSVYGAVSLSWKKEESLTIDIHVPANTEARFVFRDTDMILEPGTHHFVF